MLILADVLNISEIHLRLGPKAEGTILLSVDTGIEDESRQIKITTTSWISAMRRTADS